MVLVLRCIMKYTTNSWMFRRQFTGVLLNVWLACVLIYFNRLKMKKAIKSFYFMKCL